MIRGKATEFVAAVVLEKTLDSQTWTVEKRNINAQPGSPDEDVGLIYNLSQRKIRVEVKNAVLNSFKTGAGRTRIKVPHFKVKCHRSRSNFDNENNDRYTEHDFDLVACNVSNAIFKSASSNGPTVIDDRASIFWLKRFYEANDKADVARKSYDDWRFCFSSDLSVDGIIPRTPFVRMKHDPNWFRLEHLEENVNSYITSRMQNT